MLTASNMRTIMTEICNIDRDEIEAAGALTEKKWRDFQADPHGTFLKLNDDQQDAVTAIVNARINP